MMQKIRKTALLLALSLAIFPLASCGDDDDDEAETTDYGAAAAIAEIGERYASKDLTGNADMTALTFSSFSNEGGDPLYVREGESDALTWTPATEDDTDADHIFTALGLVRAGNVIAWLTSVNNIPRTTSGIRVKFTSAKNVKRIAFNSSSLRENLSTSGTVDMKSIRSFFALRAPSDGAVTASVTNHSIESDSAVVALVNQNGKILDGITLTPNTGTTPDAQYLSATVSAGDVILAIAKSNDGTSGTVNLNSFIFEANSSGNSGNSTTPTNVGTNELAGTTWTATKNSKTYKWTFTDSTATYDYSDSESDIYDYWYDSTKKRITLKLKSTKAGSSTSYTSASELLAYTTSARPNCTEDTKAFLAEYSSAVFDTPDVEQYSIEGDSLTLKTVFDGTLPTKQSFSKEIDGDHTISFSGTYLKMKSKSGNSKTYFCGYPEYKNGSFTVTLFSTTDQMTFTNAGTASGTYSTSGTGTNGCAVSLAFTSLPSAVSGFSTNTAYALTQGDANFDKTYTK